MSSHCFESFIPFLKYNACQQTGKCSTNAPYITYIAPSVVHIYVYDYNKSPNQISIPMSSY